MLKILLPESPRDTDYLSQVHQLRYKRFVTQYGWSEGLHAINQMEFDKYDYSKPIYLANVGDDNRVNAIVRMIQTTQPNYTLDEFNENARMTEPQKASDIVELSCTCSDRKNAPRNSLQLIIMGLMELGLKSGVQHYISTVNSMVQNMSDRLHWPSEEISPRVAMDKLSFVVLKYPINQEIYENFRTEHGFTDPLLAEEEIARCPLKNRILGM